MNKLLLIICLMPALLIVSCGLPCSRVTGPDDIAYSTMTNADCSVPYETMSGTGIILNSASDFDAMCTGSTVPVEWDFTSHTYLVIKTGHTASAPYLAGVGNDPKHSNQILVTVGLPCNFGMVPQVFIYKSFTLEIAKTTKTLRVESIDE